MASPTSTPPRARTHSPAIPTKGGDSVEYSDRFIPSRRGTNLQEGFALLPDSPPTARANVNGETSAETALRDDNLDTYNVLLRSELLGDEAAAPSVYRCQEHLSTGLLSPPSNNNLFRYRVSPSPRDSSLPSSTGALAAESRRLLPVSKRVTRKIPSVPYKVLDAPALQDDFYLNLVDWSSSNLLAVGLSSCVYLWSAFTSKVTKLCDLGPETVTSVSWTQRGSHLAVGTSLGEVQIWDVAKCSLTRTMTGHQNRVGTLAWSGHTLSSGSRDRSICMRDLASGGNDNKLFIWTPRASAPLVRFNDHTAAVKALAWSPHQNGLIASGGGTADRCIRFWNTQTSSALSSVDTGSQVCNLVWSSSVNEVVSTHGYSQNQVVVWRYPSMSKVATLTGHSTRVLYLALSPDGQTIVTGAGDETLRFWNVFPSAKPRGHSGNCSSMMDFQGRTAIR